MRTKDDVIKYCLGFKGCYIDTPFRDDNWILARLRHNKKSFAFIYERNSYVCINVKVDPEIRDFLRLSYSAVTPAYHQNKEHWNTIILDGSLDEKLIKQMISDSYEMVK